MGLSKPSNQLFDPVRKKWVEATPEEIIRQQLIHQMVEELGYPIAFLSVEQELAGLPHLQLVERESIPKRRADIIAFGKDVHPDYPLFPLMMVECKAVPLTPKFAQQVIGYNGVVQAPYLALANGDQILSGYFDEGAGHYHFDHGLPTYQSLIEREMGRLNLLSKVEDDHSLHHVR